MEKIRKANSKKKKEEKWPNTKTLAVKIIFKWKHNQKNTYQNEEEEEEKKKKNKGKEIANKNQEYVIIFDNK